MAENAEMSNNLRLSTSPLNGQNYTAWVRAVYLFLHGKGKLHHLTGEPIPEKISGSEKDKTTDDLAAAAITAAQLNQQWLRDDSLVMNWLLNTMTSQISEQFLFCKSTKEIWETVKERFSQGTNFAHIYNLKQEIRKIKQVNKPISDLIGALKIKWDQLGELEPLTTDLKSLQERAERDKIYQFLAALDSSYENLKSHILSTELKSFSQVAAQVL